MTRFYIGQPVVCVDGRVRRRVARRWPHIAWPKEGGRYVIRGNVETKVATFVLLREIRNKTIAYPNSKLRAEAGFWEERFEPATDIGELETIKNMVGMYHGKIDLRPIAPWKKKERV